MLNHTTDYDCGLIVMASYYSVQCISISFTSHYIEIEIVVISFSRGNSFRRAYYINLWKKYL